MSKDVWVANPAYQGHEASHVEQAIWKPLFEDAQRSFIAEWQPKFVPMTSEKLSPIDQAVAAWGKENDYGLPPMFKTPWSEVPINVDSEAARAAGLFQTPAEIGHKEYDFWDHDFGKYFMYAFTAAAAAVAAPAAVAAEAAAASAAGAGAETAAGMLAFETGGTVAAADISALSVLPASSPAIELGSGMGSVLADSFEGMTPEMFEAAAEAGAAGGAAGSETPGILKTIWDYSQYISPLSNLRQLAAGSGGDVTAVNAPQTSNTINSTLIPVNEIAVINTNPGVSSGGISSGQYASYLSALGPGGSSVSIPNSVWTSTGELSSQDANHGLQKYLVLGGLVMLLILANRRN